MKQIGVGTFTVTPRMRALVDGVLDSGRISYGPMCRTLESSFAQMHGCRFGVLSNSGTSSLQVAVQAMKELYDWKDGSEILVPSVTFVATVNIVLHCGLVPVLVDVEPDYYGIDPGLVGRALTRKTVAIIPVHLFGMPCNIRDLYNQADYDGIPIIEDSCETVMASHHGKSVGSWGSAGCFSMYVAHLLTAGVGGISTTNDPRLAEIMRSLVNHGRDGIYISIDDDDGLEGEKLREVISKRFNFQRIGHSYRITELEAALALAQLDDLPGIIEKRRHNADRLTTALSQLEVAAWMQLPAVRPNATHSWMMYPIVLRKLPKEPVVSYLEEHGVETREMLRLTDQPCYQGMWNPDDYPVADWINKRGFYVASHQGLTDDDIDYMALTIGEAIGQLV